MYVAHRSVQDYDEDELPITAAAPRAFPIPPTPAPAPMPSAPIERSHYAGSRNRPAILLVAVLHVLAIVALVKFDVVHIAPKQADPILIDLHPLAEAPPEQPQTRQEQAPSKVETPIVAPPPIVAAPAAPVAVRTVAVAPPAPAPQASPAPAAPAPAAVAAPIVPPDGSAANLGNPAPRYPVESRRAREEGTVRLRVLISAAGSVLDIAVARSSGFERLDKAALDTVRRWRFRPGTQAGTPVEAAGYLSVPFVLSH